MKRVMDRASGPGAGELVGQSYPRSSRSRRAGRAELPSVLQEQGLVVGQGSPLVDQEQELVVGQGSRLPWVGGGGRAG